MKDCSLECRITDTDRRDLALITFYEEGHSPEETAHKFNLSLSYTKTLIRNIVTVHRPHELRQKEWYEAFKSGMTVEEIAEACDAFAPFVKNQIDQYYPLYY